MSTTSRPKRIRRVLGSVSIVLGLAAATALAVVPSASASVPSHQQPSPATGQQVLASDLLTPLRTAVTPDGVAYVSENAAGRIDRIGPGGHSRVVYTDPDGYEVGGLSTAGRALLFTVTRSDPTTMENLDSWLKVLTPYGHFRTIADLYSYEQSANPDQVTTYGFHSIDPTCAAQWPSDQGPATYTGAVDSHPYATYAPPNGWTYVADAGGNDVLLVSPSGHVSTVAVLPAIPFTMTSAAVTSLGIPTCFVGTTYYFEPVPTIERGPDGRLYVTSLPGGPEGTQLGARGSVFAVSPFGAHGHHGLPGHGSYGGHGFSRSHAAGRASLPAHHHGGSWISAPEQVVTGLVEPTGLAISPRGTLYVAELFGNDIVRVSRDGQDTSPMISTTNPADVEWTPWGLYYTSNVLSGTEQGSSPAGQLIRSGWF
jgi:hypothetical protein